MTQTTMTVSAVDVVIQAAIQMEEMGRDFYDALGAVALDPALADLCRRLAMAEAKHRDTYRRMRYGLAQLGQTAMVADEQIVNVRQAVKQNVLPDAATVRRLAATGKYADLLDAAIAVEKSLVEIYQRLAANLPPGTAIDSIIAEEQSHVHLLTQARRFRTVGPVSLAG